MNPNKQTNNKLAGRKILKTAAYVKFMLYVMRFHSQMQADSKRANNDTMDIISYVEFQNAFKVLLQVHKVKTYVMEWFSLQGRYLFRHCLCLCFSSPYSFLILSKHSVLTVLSLYK